MLELCPVGIRSRLLSLLGPVLPVQDANSYQAGITVLDPYIRMPAKTIYAQEGNGTVVRCPAPSLPVLGVLGCKRAGVSDCSLCLSRGSPAPALQMIPVILNSPSDQEVVVTIASDLGDRLDLLNLTVTFPPGETGPLVRTLPRRHGACRDDMESLMPCYYSVGSSVSDPGGANVGTARRGP